MTKEEMTALDRDYQESVDKEEINLESLPKHLHIIIKAPGDERSRGARAAEYVLSGPGNAASVLKKFNPIGDIPPCDMVLFEFYLNCGKRNLRLFIFWVKVL